MWQLDEINNSFCSDRGDHKAQIGRIFNAKRKPIL